MKTHAVRCDVSCAEEGQQLLGRDVESRVVLSRWRKGQSLNDVVANDPPALELSFPGRDRDSISIQVVVTEP